MRLVFRPSSARLGVPDPDHEHQLRGVLLVDSYLQQALFGIARRSRLSFVFKLAVARKAWSSLLRMALPSNPLRNPLGTRDGRSQSSPCQAASVPSSNIDHAFTRAVEVGFISDASGSSKTAEFSSKWMVTNEKR